MAVPKFYLEPRQTGNGKQAINMFYSFYGQRLQYYTGIRIEPKFYKEVDSKGKPTDRSDVNKCISENTPYASVIKSNLKQIALDVQNIANTAKANKIPVTKEYLRSELDKIHKHKPENTGTPIEYDFISFFEKIISDSKSGVRVMQKGKKAGQPYSLNAIKNLNTSFSAIKRYIQAKKIKSLKFSDIDKAFYENFKKFCFGPSERKEISTFASYIKDIKSVMNEARELGFQKADGHKATSFIMPSYESDTIYLTKEEIDRIAALDLSDYSKFIIHKVPFRDKNKRNISNLKKELEFRDEKITYSVLDKCRDMFLIGCYTGLRFGNFSNLELNSIEGNFIKVKQIKTGTRVSIPIMEKLKPVLAKYPQNLPTLSNQKFNMYVKHVAQLAGLDEIRDIRNFKGNKENVTSEPLYKLITSHCCRRSYATNMFKLGIPTMLIMSSTGHKTEVSFLKYIRATNEDKAILMAEAMKKLGL